MSVVRRTPIAVFLVALSLTFGVFLANPAQAQTEELCPVALALEGLQDQIEEAAGERLPLNIGNELGWELGCHSFTPGPSPSDPLPDPGVPDPTDDPGADEAPSGGVGDEAGEEAGEEAGGGAEETQTGAGQEQETVVLPAAAEAAGGGAALPVTGAGAVRTVLTGLLLLTLGLGTIRRARSVSGLH